MSLPLTREAFANKLNNNINKGIAKKGASQSKKSSVSKMRAVGKINLIS